MLDGKKSSAKGVDYFHSCSSTRRHNDHIPRGLPDGIAYAP